MPRTYHAHRLVAKTAQDMAAAVFEELMKRDKFYAAYAESHPTVPRKKLQEHFIRKNFWRYLDQARHTLTDMLRGNYPESLKDEIADALVKDARVRGIRAPSVQGNYQ